MLTKKYDDITQYIIRTNKELIEVYKGSVIVKEIKSERLRCGYIKRQKVERLIISHTREAQLEGEKPLRRPQINTTFII